MCWQFYFANMNNRHSIYNPFLLVESAMKFYEHLGLVPQKIGMEKML